MKPVAAMKKMAKNRSARVRNAVPRTVQVGNLSMRTGSPVVAVRAAVHKI